MNYLTTNIANPGPNDILCGRGGGTNAHSGNIKFRKLVAAHKLRYLAANKSDKPGVARDVVREWRSMDPPGRFLAKVDGTKRTPAYPASDNDKSVLWYDVGDKKAREKASQCLRERNGAANEAVAALVKTVTASGEACPEDYATLMNKAALVKAQNDLTIQQQHEMIRMGHAQQSHMQQGGMMGGMGGSNMGQEPFGMQAPSGSTEDDLIEAEIQRLLQQRQQQLMSGGGLAGGGYTGEQQQMPLNQSNGSRRGSANDGRQNKENPNAPKAYMGEENVMREYEQLMQKQRELNMMMGGSGGFMDQQQMMMNQQGMGMNGMQGMGMNQMSMQGQMNQMNMMMQGGMDNSYGGGMPNQVQSNPNPDAAKDYMARLRMLRQGGDAGGGGNQGGMANSNNMPEQAYSSGRNNAGSSSNGKDFTIEEYQASLQQFLSHNDDLGGRNNSMMSKNTQHAGNLSSNAYGNGGGMMSNSGGMMGSTIQCIQVPTNLEDGKGTKRGRRRSVDDMDLPIGRNTFQSEGSMGDTDIRGTFRSVDTLDMMSIGNSINDIIEDDARKNPDAAKQYLRRLSTGSGKMGLKDFAFLPGQTVEIKTMDHGRGSGGGLRKKKQYQQGGTSQAVGTTLSVQTKGCDGPSSGGMGGLRGSQLSMDLRLDDKDDGSRMSFGNM